MILIFTIFYLKYLQKSDISPFFTKSFTSTSLKSVYYPTTAFKVVKDGEFNTTVNELTGYTHYIFVKSPSILCTASIQLLINKLPKCSIYTKIHKNTVPREYYNKLYTQLPYLDYIFSSTFTIIDNCIVNQLHSTRQYSFSFIKHLSLYSQVFNWYIYKDKDYLALNIDSSDVCLFYIYNYPFKDSGNDRVVDQVADKSINVSLSRPFFNMNPINQK